MVKTFLASAALLAAVVGGIAYNYDCCPFTNYTSCSSCSVVTPESNSENSSTPSTTPSSSCCETSTVQTTSCGDCSQNCCALPSRVQLINASAANNAANLTLVTIEGLDCPSCAKKLTNMVKTMNGVQSAEADVKTSVLRVQVQEKASVSPKALWETVEKAGFKPTRLVSPAGTFTTKPTI